MCISVRGSPNWPSTKRMIWLNVWDWRCGTLKTSLEMMEELSLLCRLVEKWNRATTDWWLSRDCVHENLNFLQRCLMKIKEEIKWIVRGWQFTLMNLRNAIWSVWEHNNKHKKQQLEIGKTFSFPLRTESESTASENHFDQIFFLKSRKNDFLTLLAVISLYFFIIYMINLYMESDQLIAQTYFAKNGGKQQRRIKKFCFA